MAITVNHDVAVVPILDLENIASHGVCSHRLNEIQSSFLEGSSVWTAIFVNEITVKVVDFGTTHFVSRRSVRHDIDDTALRNQKRSEVALSANIICDLHQVLWP